MSDQKVVDLSAIYLSDNRIPDYPADTTAPVSRPTVQRIRSADDQTLMGIRPATIGLLYNFLCQCEELKSELYNQGIRIRSAHKLAPVQEALQHHFRAKDGPLTNAKLKSLAGTFHLYRKAWTSPNADTYIRCILRLDWVGDALFYTEEQKFYDTVARLPVDEKDTGIVMPFGMNVVMLAHSENKDLLKFFSMHDFTPYPDGLLPVHAMSGNCIAVYGKGPHPGFKAFARRVDPEEAKTGFLLGLEMDETVLNALLN